VAIKCNQAYSNKTKTTRYNKQGNDTAMLLDDIDLDNNISSIAADDHRDVIIIIIIIPRLLD
jgi:hypothetical protein